MEQTNLNAKAYLIAQSTSGLSIGDKVKVTRTAETNENGWNNSWTKPMDINVGKTLIIAHIDIYGIHLKGTCYSYPFFVLEPIKEPIPCQI